MREKQISEIVKAVMDAMGIEPMSDEEKLVSDGLMKISEACKFTGMSESTLYELMDQGLPYVRMTSGSRRIPRRALIKHAADRLVIRREAS